VRSELLELSLKKNKVLLGVEASVNALGIFPY
jgi:hypothetical protein